jgi:hypothetical protein
MLKTFTTVQDIPGLLVAVNLELNIFAGLFFPKLCATLKQKLPGSPKSGRKSKQVLSFSHETRGKRTHNTRVFRFGTCMSVCLSPSRVRVRVKVRVRVSNMKKCSRKKCSPFFHGRSVTKMVAMEMLLSRAQSNPLQNLQR